MKYESIKHSFLVILIATTIVGCAGNSVQPPASQYQTSSESFDSRGDTSSIDFEDVDKPVAFIYQAPSVGDMILITLTSTIWALLALAMAP